MRSLKVYSLFWSSTSKIFFGLFFDFFRFFFFFFTAPGACQRLDSLKGIKVFCKITLNPNVIMESRASFYSLSYIV